MTDKEYRKFEKKRKKREVKSPILYKQTKRIPKKKPQEEVQAHEQEDIQPLEQASQSMSPLIEQHDAEMDVQGRKQGKTKWPLSKEFISDVDTESDEPPPIPPEPSLVGQHKDLKTRAKKSKKTSEEDHRQADLQRSDSQASSGSRRGEKPKQSSSRGRGEEREPGSSVVQKTKILR